MWKLPQQDLDALIDAFQRSDWREMRLRMDGVELLLGKDAEPVFSEVSMSTTPGMFLTFCTS